MNVLLSKQQTVEWIFTNKRGEMTRRILITSGKGGVGKTSVTAHLGYALSRMGKRVVVIDLDTGLNNLDVVMGVEDKVTYDLSDALSGKCRVKQTLIEYSPTLYLIASRSGGGYDLTSQNVKDITEGLKGRFDYVLIDSPAGIDYGFRRAAGAAEEVILVVTPTLTSLRDADKVLNAMNNYDVKNVGIIVNKMRGDLLLEGAVIGVDEIRAVLKTPVVGCIPEDDSVYLATRCDLNGSRAEKAFKMTAKSLIKGSGKIYDCAKYYKGFGGALRRAMRRIS